MESPWALFGPLQDRAEEGGGGSRQPGARGVPVPVYYLANTTAGLFAGDRLAADVHLLPGTAARFATPAATCAFAMPQGRAWQKLTFHLGEGAFLDYAPEPLIPYAGSDLEQETHFLLLPGAALRALDLLLLGRLAYGEVLQLRRLVSRVQVSVGGRPVLADQLVVEPERFGREAILAGWGHHTCLGTLYLAGAACRGADPGAVNGGELEAAAARSGARVGVTCPDPQVVVVKALGPHPPAVRQVLAAAEAALREGGGAAPPCAGTEPFPGKLAVELTGDGRPEYLPARAR